MYLKTIVLSFLLLSFTSATFAQWKDTKLKVGEAILMVKMGKKFTIDLKSNATTGYGWQIYDFNDSTVVSKVGNKYVEPKKRGNDVGVAGVEQWVFKANKQGEAVLYFKYCRPWDADNPSNEKRKYIIKVK